MERRDCRSPRVTPPRYPRLKWNRLIRLQNGKRVSTISRPKLWQRSRLASTGFKGILRWRSRSSTELFHVCSNDLLTERTRSDWLSRIEKQSPRSPNELSFANTMLCNNAVQSQLESGSGPKESCHAIGTRRDHGHGSR